jgi:ketosteroid isomerase-like protein
MINSMARARYYKNARAIAASYSPHATIFDLEPPRTHLGIDIADMQAWLDTWDGPIKIEPHDFQIIVTGDIAFCHGYMRIDGNKKDVGHRVSFWMRETLCFARKGDAWQIVHEHTSVPFYMDGRLLPVCDLEPA